MRTLGASAHAGPPGGAYVLLTDGSTAEVRPARPEDAPAVRAMHEAMSSENLHLRFFTLSRRSAEQEAHRVCRPASPDHAALLAWLDGRLVGVASYEPVRAAGSAEIAFAVPDDMHGRGVATLLLEHLVSIARQRGLRAFTATTLSDNSAMVGVFTAAGLPSRCRLAEGVFDWTFALPGAPGAGAGPGLDGYLDSVASRERRADAASLRYLLRPRSVAVIGASRGPGTASRALLHNIVAGGFDGNVYAVNPRARHMEGVPCIGSVADLPEAVDLAVIAVAGPAVPKVAEACGRRGIKALVVLTPGLGGAGADLLATCRRHGMRLAGPASAGIMVPGRGLNASLAARPAAPGMAGLVTQSGGVGIALLEHLSRLGIGVSSFAAVGDKYDVSSNDLLMWWEQDAGTRLAILYVESFGNPRAFARTARRVGQRMPVLTVSAGRPAGPAVISREALLSQAGVIAAASPGELVAAVALLASQPCPAGRRVAVVSNAGGAGRLAAAACRDSGLEVATLQAATRRRLRSLLPAGATVAGPVATTAAATTHAFRSCLEQVAADDGVDAVLAVAVPTALCAPGPATCSAAVAKPVAAVLPGQAESVRLLPRSPEVGAWLGAGAPAADGIPAYSDPGSACRALAHAARYAAWRARQAGPDPEPGGLRPAAARDLIAGFLAGHPGGGWLPPGPAAELLGYYRIPLTAPRMPGGAQARIGLVQDDEFGPLITLGPGGTTADVPGGQPVRLAPLTEADAQDMIQALAAGPPPATAGPGALAGTLVRVARMAGDLPELAELELGPAVTDGPVPDSSDSGEVRVRISPAGHADPFLRRLRGGAGPDHRRRPGAAALRPAGRRARSPQDRRPGANGTIGSAARRMPGAG